MVERTNRPESRLPKPETIESFTDALRGMSLHHLTLIDGRKVFRSSASSVGILETLEDGVGQKRSILTTVTVDSNTALKRIYPLEMPLDLDDDSSVLATITALGNQPEATGLDLSEEPASQEFGANSPVDFNADKLIKERAAELYDVGNFGLDDFELEDLAMMIHDAVGRDVLAQ